MRSLLYFLLILFCISCTKITETISEQNSLPAAVSLIAPAAKPTKTASWQHYTIQEGAHYCDQSSTKSVSGTSMSFKARFDSTCIYPAIITDYNHAYDVNKLYGFSEGINNQYNSARIGWRWLNDELQLFAYVYVNGTLLRDAISYDPPFIKTVSIGQDISCNISLSGNNYIFTVDGVIVSTARGVNSFKYSGYQQYPYFGGTLAAPHLMNFYIQ
jgi:hypothetical protein